MLKKDEQIARRLARVRGEPDEFLASHYHFVNSKNYFDIDVQPDIHPLMLAREPPTGLDADGVFLNSTMDQLMNLVHRDNLMMNREIDDSMYNGAFCAVRFAIKIIRAKYFIEYGERCDFYLWRELKFKDLKDIDIGEDEILVKVYDKYFYTSIIIELEKSVQNPAFIPRFTYPPPFNDEVTS